MTEEVLRNYIIIQTTKYCSESANRFVHKSISNKLHLHFTIRNLRTSTKQLQNTWYKSFYHIISNILTYYTRSHAGLVYRLWAPRSGARPPIEAHRFTLVTRFWFAQKESKSLPPHTFHELKIYLNVLQLGICQDPAGGVYRSSPFSLI